MEKTKNISIPQICYMIEKNILQIVFPECYRKPYRIRSLKHLQSFLVNAQDAANKDKCDETAPDKWQQMSEKEREEIETRLKNIFDNTNDLLGCIKDLKDFCENAHPPCTNYNSVITYYKEIDNMDIVEALQTCRPFYEKQF